jgi:pimeloyl-ACP methyl ester carboxylesterase
MPLQLPEPARSGFVEVNRTRLRVWEWGDADSPAIICVHGASDHGRMWDGFAPELAALGHRVIAVDQRGHGDSGRLSSGAVWGACALDLALLAEWTGGAVGIVGHSFGGGQSTFAAGVFPEWFRWVVNIDGLGAPADQFTEWDIVEASTNSLARIDRYFHGPPRVYGSIDEMVDRRARVNARLPREWIEHLVRHGSREVEGGYAWKADPMFSIGIPGEFSVDHLLAELSLCARPVLVITGAEPDMWSEHTADEIELRLASMPDARHVEIADAGHYVHIEQPAAVLDAIKGFLAEVEVPS